jgi:hypothetical protein
MPPDALPLSPQAIIDSGPAPSAPPAQAPALTNPTPIVDPGAPPGDVSDDDLKALLRGRREQQGSAAPVPGDDASPPVPTTTPAPSGDPKIQQAVDAALQARIKEAEQREAALQAYRAQGERIRQEAEAYAEQRKREADAQVEAARRRMLEDPLAFAKEAGWDPVALVDNVANYDTPQGRLERQLRAQAQEIAALKDGLSAKEKAAQQAAQQAAAQASEVEIANRFVTHAIQKNPALEEAFKRPGMGEFLLRQADAYAVRTAKERYGIAPTWDEIADWVGSTYGFGQASPKTTTAPAKTEAGKAARGISQAAASERSSSNDRPFHLLSEQEQERLLLQEQRERRQSRGAQR